MSQGNKSVINLYILSEDDTDDMFYTGCIENIMNVTVKNIFRKLRKGGGIGEVRSKSKILLKQIKYGGTVENTFFVIALDNDRRPAHPNHEILQGISEKERKSGCRFCEIERTIQEILGKDRSSWPIQGAVAVPVQMLESWLLLICNSNLYKEEASLPIFSRKDSPLAQAYFKSQHIKNQDQLKDLCDKEKAILNIVTDEDFCLHCVAHLISENIQTLSPSFALFKKQIETWKHCSHNIKRI